MLSNSSERPFWATLYVFSIFYLKALSIFVMLNIEYFTQRRFPNERFIQEASLYSGFEFISRCIDGCLSSGQGRSWPAEQYRLTASHQSGRGCNSCDRSYSSCSKSDRRKRTDSCSCSGQSSCLCSSSNKSSCFWGSQDPAGRQYRLYVRACRAQGYRPRTGLSGRQADLDSGQ